MRFRRTAIGRDEIAARRKSVVCLGNTANGHSLYPLYFKAGTQPIFFWR